MEVYGAGFLCDSSTLSAVGTGLGPRAAHVMLRPPTGAKLPRPEIDALTVGGCCLR